MAFLPVTMEECKERGWDRPDFVYVCGDGYVDHPSFGHAIISRLLEAEGFKVAMLPQPEWLHKEEIQRFGEPRLGFLVSSGVIDSMVNHYTANKLPRSQDLYSPGGVKGKRPNRAVIVYCNLIRQVYGKVPIIIGGIEASLRRFAHYDYLDDKIRQSILVDSGADLLSYGMGEQSILEIAKKLDSGVPINEIHDVRGTCYTLPEKECVNMVFEDAIVLPSFKEVSQDKAAYAKSFMIQSREQESLTGIKLVEPHAKKWVIQNPPSLPMSVELMDRVYNLPYERHWHPMYDKLGGIPAFNEIEFSITSHRGCFGGCSFCALNYHQGRRIQHRSQESILAEAEALTKQKGFKGYIHDVGGPTANFREMACKKQETKGVCKTRQCLFPEPCKNLNVNYDEYIDLLRKVRKIKGVKKVFIRSGLRYDHMLLDKSNKLLREICEHHISGQLKVAPEHVDDKVLRLMGKPGKKVFDTFVDEYHKMNRQIGKEQYIVPYLIASHPGSDLSSAIKLAQYLKKHKINPEQVQDFYPTPATISTCMYYTGIDPRSMKKVYVPRSKKERAYQRALLQFYLPENYDLVREALGVAGRQDLIGYGQNCLVQPKKVEKKSKKLDNKYRKKKRR